MFRFNSWFVFLNMGKDEKIIYWINSAEEDWKTIEVLMKGKRYMYALFFAHLAIEKLFKASWVKEHIENQPPKTHNLEFLYGETSLQLPDIFLTELRIINAWNIEGRYPDYLNKVGKGTTKQYTEEKLKMVNDLRLWLLENLPSKK